MGAYEWPGLFVILLFTLVVTIGPISSKFPRLLQKLIIAALFLRIFGALLRHYILLNVYRIGDAIGYYTGGVKYSAMIWDFDFSFLTPAYGDTRLWGTPMVKYISGFIISVIGPTMRGEFLFFGFLSLIGIFLFIKSFQASYSLQGLKRYALWVLVWPSLWFWPSSAGKDALILLGAGMVVYGYAGKPDKIRWGFLLFGLALTSIIRPHVAGVLIVSIAAAHWLSLGRRWTVSDVLQGIAIVVIGIFVLQKGLTDLRLEDADLEGISEYVERRASYSKEGGSALETPGGSIYKYPLAVVNVLLRPGPWEATSVTYFASFVEIYAIWVLLWIRRRKVIDLLKEWRSHRLLRVSVPFIIFFTAMLGMAAGNLGIIARQRILLLPFLLLWAEAIPHQQLVKAPKNDLPARPRLGRPVVFRNRKRALDPVKQ